MSDKEFSDRMAELNAAILASEERLIELRKVTGILREPVVIVVKEAA